MKKKTKFFLLRLSIILIFTILAGRVWYIQVVMGSYYQAQGDTSKIRLEPVQALRGIIYDRQGRQLVFNAPSWDVDIVPHGVPGAEANRIYSQVSAVFHGNPSPSSIARTVAANDWHSYAPVLIKANVSPAIAMIIKQLHTQLPGVSAVPSSRRQYVNDPTLSLAHILGYTGEITQDAYTTDTRLYPAEHFGNSDTIGRDGVEVEVDPYLHGVNGTEKVEVDAGERPVRILSHGTTVPGDRVYLTIDAAFQRQVANDMQAALHHVGLRQGVAVVENVHTGEILAMVSLPSFNNNWFSGGISEKRYSMLAQDPAHPLNNLAIAGLYPPGSTYKVVTAAAALETGAVDANTTVDDTGALEPCPGCHVFHGWKAGGLGSVNIVGALAKSSDIYFYTVAGGDPVNYPNIRPVGPNRLAHYAKLFGLGSLTGIDLPGELAGQVPSAYWFNHLNNPLLRHPGDVWHIGDTYNMAIGQGFDAATPLQMANIAACIANGGTLYQPRVIHSITGRVIPTRGVLKHAHVIRPFVPQIIRRNFINPYDIHLIQEGMHDSVAWPGWEGTSLLVQDPRIDAAGKTGTAEDPHGADSWWIGYAPYNNPQIAVAVLAPYAESEGAYVAAPIAHKIFEDYFHLKPISSEGNPVWLDDVIIESVGAQ